MPLPKLLIVGHGRHGKDTVCEILEKNYNFKFLSSSQFASEKLIYPALRNLYNYSSPEECYADRHNHRREWYELISAYCKPDPAKLGKEIFKEYDIYCGLRNKKEFHSMKNQKVFDYAIWVDRSDYLPPESKDSMTIEEWMTDYTIDNNGSIDDLHLAVDSLINTILQ